MRVKECGFGFFAGFGLRLIGVHTRLTVDRQHFAGFFQTKVRSKGGAEELLHGVQNRAQGSGHFKAVFHGSRRHDLRGHNAAVDNRDGDDRFVVADQRNEHEHADPDHSHRSAGGGNRAPLSHQFFHVDCGAHAEDHKAHGPLADLRKTGLIDHIIRDPVGHEEDQEQKQAHEH